MNVAVLLAQTSGAFQNLGGLVVNVLAVLGGAAVGWFGCGLLLQLLTKALTHKPVPRPMLNLVRVLGVIALGWLVALLVFGSGGFRLGGSGGAGTTNGGAERTESGTGVKKFGFGGEEPPTTGRSTPPQTSNGTLRVEVLGDDRVQDGRFYRVEKEPSLRNLADLRTDLKERRQKRPELQHLLLVIYEDSPDKDHPAVTDVMRWAKENELRVTLDFPKGKAP